MEKPHLSTEFLLSGLGNSIVFRHLDEKARRYLLEISERVAYSAGERIIKEGEISPYLYVVIQGTVNVIVKEKEEKEVFICTIGEGDAFGEAALFLNMKRTADVVSADNSILLQFHRKDLLKFFKREPSTGIKILMLMVYTLLKKLRSANRELAFERRSDYNQEEVDDFISDFLNEKL